MWFCRSLMCLLAVYMLPSDSADTSSFQVTTTDNGFTISLADVEKQIIDHTYSSPWIFLGKSQTSFIERDGNFQVNDYVQERTGLDRYEVHEEENGAVLLTLFNEKAKVELELTSTDTNQLVIRTKSFPENYNRIWFRLTAQPEEHIYGGGEQFSYLDLSGRKFPIWTREQGIGRNKTMPLSLLADAFENGAGGDYHTTYFPLPTFISSRRFYCHISGSQYMELDFSHTEFHEVMVLGSPGKIHFNSGKSLKDTVEKLTGFLGRQPVLPEWVSDGAILGVQGGTQRMLDILKKSRANGLSVVGLWIQDWSGEKFTDFGKRVFWNWQWNEKLYPGLDTVIKELAADGVKLLAYINPHLNKDGGLFQEAENKGYFMKNANGETYIMVNGDNPCGTVDLTNQEAFDWYKGIVKKNIIEFGFGGWMADYSEYTPTDGIFHSGMPGDVVHNLFPVLWARLNREAVEEAGKLGQVMFYMRAGGTGSQEYSVMSWAGDQNVDFSYDDGLASTIPAALSLGLSGFGLTHYDIGGFTTLVRQGVAGAVAVDVKLTRSEELFFRGAEMAVFTPVMRSHEGNKPSANFQVYNTDETLQKFATLVNMFRALKPYSRYLQEENAQVGIPMQRPLFLHYDNDPVSYTVQYQYMYGTDLLLAPVLELGATEWIVYLPPDDWVYLYNGTNYVGGRMVQVPAPSGRPPVFYRASSSWKETFDHVAKVAAEGGGRYSQQDQDKCPE